MIKTPQKYVRPLIKLRMEGKTNEEIAAAVGLRVASVNVYLSRLRKQYDLQYPPRPTDCNGKRWTPEKLEKLAQAAAVKTYPQVGEEFGIGPGRVCQLMARWTETWVHEQRMRDAR